MFPVSARSTEGTSPGERNRNRLDDELPELAVKLSRAGMNNCLRILIFSAAFATSTAICVEIMGKGNVEATLTSDNLSIQSENGFISCSYINMEGEK